MRPVMTRQKLPAITIVRWTWTISVLTVLMVTILASPTQAQVMRKKDAPIQAPPTSTAPPAQELRRHDSMVAPGPVEAPTMREDVATHGVAYITDVRVAPNAQSVIVSFRAFPNTAPLVELSTVKPKVGADGQWGFPPGSGSVARPAGGDKARGEYVVDMNQQLEPGTTYYYIISARNDDGARHQVTGKFSQSGSFVVRYRGFICQEKTFGPGADEIYAIVSASFADSNGRPATVTATHPHVIVDDVESGDVHGDPGRNIYQGEARNLVLTVTLMEHDQGQAYEYRDAVNGAVVGTYGALTFSYPPLLLGDLVSGDELAGAMLDVSTAVQQALGPGDDVIGTTTRLITAEEMKSMANQPSSDEQGIHYNFFTEHRGHGGIYRVYFDIITN